VQAKHGREIERADLLPGDLLFFANDEGKGSVHHVGMYIGDNQMIHSPDSASSIEIVSLQGYKLEKEHSVSRRYW
jgi:cell wall-associated NlpC family hydrolase